MNSKRKKEKETSEFKELLLVSHLMILKRKGESLLNIKNRILNKSKFKIEF
jgi:hypothetical protein